MLLYESTLRVPLVVVAPHVAARRIDVPVSLVDLAPTILRAAGVTPAPEMKGRNLIADVAGDSRTDLYSETEYPHVAGWLPLQALTDGRWKAIRAGAATEVYDLQHDPGEQHDVATAQPAVATAIASRAAEIHGAATDRGTTLSADAGERLRALGYVASTAQTPPASSAPNPRTTIAAWNEFEDALAALNHHKVSAVDALKSLAAAHPDALVFQTTYARSLKDAGRPIAALKVYRDAARRWPGDADLVHDLAVAAREAASTAAGSLADSLREEAARADEAALAIDPHSATAANGLGLLAVDAGRPEAAAQAFAKATTLDPNNASYWTNLGNARRALHDTAAARQAYDRALAVDPAYADAANGIGVMLVEGKRPADAVPWFERAIAASPDLVEARLNLGIALQQSGDPRRAAVEYKQVLAAPPRFARERDAAGKLLASLGTVK
jgi:tetratricopeptide (TPR) repeat protein